ncbi:MAG: sigma factor-like helix-turn-helix DNA-binding protein [Clostridia bacterium]|nr:sigma factor-like helix-turn-helix DNA-binding protein [Clostridia bacterium]
MMEKQQSRTDRQSVRANAPAACGKASLNARMMLRDVRHCQLRTLALCARAERYREMAMQATGRTDAIRVSGTGERSKVETYILELWDVHNELQEEIARLTEKSRQTEQLIKTLPDERYRAVLELRYLCGMTWEEIASRLHFTLRWVHKLHRDAIDQLAGLEA